MSLRQELKHELKAVGLAMLYFGCWIGALLLLKQLVLAAYQIAFHDWSLARIGALILSKIVLVLEHVPLGAWVRTQPAWVDLAVRTLLYPLGVLLVMLLEKSFEGRHEHGGFGPSLRTVFQHADIHHFWLNTICLSGALPGYNVLSVIRRHLGAGGLLRLFSALLSDDPGATRPEPP